MKKKQTKNQRNESCIDDLHRIVIRKDICDALHWTSGMKIVQNVQRGGVLISLSKDVCRICAAIGEDMYKDFGICKACSRKIQEAEHI